MSKTRIFEVRNNNPYLDGKKIQIWGIRLANAIYSDKTVQNLIDNLDDYVKHGVNCFSVFIQGANPGNYDPTIGFDGFNPDGTLKQETKQRLEKLILEADKRDMVVNVGLFYFLKDHNLKDEKAIEKACRETARFLYNNGLRNVFIDIVNEYGSERYHHSIFKRGVEEKARLHQWIKEEAPLFCGISDVRIGDLFVRGDEKYKEFLDYPGADIILLHNYVEPLDVPKILINNEPGRPDDYGNEGVERAPGEIDKFLILAEKYRRAPNAYFFAFSAWNQAIGGFDGECPHFEIGGSGRSEKDRGVGWYFNWVRKNVGRYEYPNHIRE
ncbi:MAG: hypothetical protein QXI67_06195 [Candidatus Bathyarchaeia archaeon]